jgi:PAS domain S-box-containing protein
MTGVDVEEAHSVIQSDQSQVSPVEITWATEPSGEVHEDCPSWREFTGQTFEEIEGFGWLNAVHPEDRERARESWVSTITTGSIYVSEWRLRRGDGAIRHMSVRGVPALENGLVRRVAGFCGDITDAINYLQLIMREREFSDAVIECLPGIFYMTDEAGNLIRWNRTAEIISGYTAEELATKHGFDLVHPRHVEMLHENRKKLFESGGSAELEAEFLTKSGKHVPFYVNGRRVSFHGKSYAMGVGLDISKQKNAEQELRELNAALEDRVKERTKELEESYKELEAFSYTVSHDLRAPLQAIRGFSEILKEDFAEKLNGEGNELLDRIIEADERMARLINDILSYARLEREGISMEHVPLTQLMRHVQADFELRLKEIGGQLEVSRDLPEVEGDLTLLAQVFTNLFQNAINYRRKDTPLVLNVSSQRQPDGIVLAVSDNGQGIAPQYQSKLFKPFQRLHSNAEVPGTGLGLSTVKKSVERMGGKVWLESEVNKGTTFFVRLKAAT